MYYWNMNDWGYGGWIMFIIGIVIIGLVVWAIVAATRGGQMAGWGAAPRRDALDIAKERYARGEINKEQFEEIKKGLM